MSRAALRADEELAAALLPVLLHRVNNTTQLLLGVHAMMTSGGDVPARCSRDLGVASEEAHELGWLLGLLAGGLGADLLLARHENAGLAPLMRLVRDGLRRKGRELELQLESIPRVQPSANSPLVIWTIALVVWNAAGEATPDRKLTIGFERNAGRWFVRGDRGAGEGWFTLAREACARLSGAEWSSEGEAWNLALPGSWLEPATAPGSTR